MDMFEEEEPSVIKDARTLTESFQPEEVVCRDGQISAIRDSLKPLLKNQPVRPVLLHGPPGSGKTTTARHVASAFAAARSSALTAYVNCWANPSAFGMLYAALNSLGAGLGVHRQGVPVDELFDRVAAAIKGKPAVLVIDEVDQLQEEDVLYNLLRFENAALVLIVNKPGNLATIDERVRSRLLTAEAVHFPAYATDEIGQILFRRAEAGLYPRAASKSQLQRIAELADGDARVALGILRAAAEEAERKGWPSLRDSSIESALAKALQLERETKLAQLSEHQRVLYDCLKEGALPAAELFQAYRKACKRAKLELQNDRTTRKYLERLSKLGLVRASGDVRWRAYEQE